MPPAPASSLPGSRPGVLHSQVIDWYDTHARSLPWRQPSADAWAVLVSEVMLQQTPVARVVPVYQEWMTRWPTPAALARAPVGDAIRAWGRLGYPLRALRLHSAAVTCVDLYAGQVPSGPAQLRALPGVGDYTAAAVGSFAFGQRHVVLDTNVRRVHARLLAGTARAPGGTPRADERAAAQGMLPGSPVRASRWAAAVMELGAVVCTARSPRCQTCPVAGACAWRAAGYPPSQDAPRRSQAYAGTDRATRGALLAVLRLSTAPLSRSALLAAVTDAGGPGDRVQLDRCLDALVSDHLVDRQPDGTYALPG